MTQREINQLADKIQQSHPYNNKVTIPALKVEELKYLLYALKVKKQGY